MKNKKAANWLKAAFIVGAVIDAGAVLPMLIPELAKMMWGFEGMKGDYYFAMGCGASLMIGWTLLLIWAFLKPLERRGVALLTLMVVAGIMAAQIVAIANGAMNVGKALQSFIIQGPATALFITAYFISGKAAKEKT